MDTTTENLPGLLGVYMAVFYGLMKLVEFLVSSYRQARQDRGQGALQQSTIQDNFITQLLRRVEALEKREMERESSHRTELEQIREAHGVEVRDLKREITERDIRIESMQRDISNLKQQNLQQERSINELKSQRS